MPGGSGGLTGGIIVGLLMAHNIPRKLVADKAGIHESSLSRKINDKDDFQTIEIIRVCVAIGELKSDPRCRQEA